MGEILDYVGLGFFNVDAISKCVECLAGLFSFCKHVDFARGSQFTYPLLESHSLELHRAIGPIFY